MSDYTPKPKHKFTFGLWTVSNPGRDPFGDATRPPVDPNDAVRRLAELGAYGVNLHDNDLVPFDATPEEHDRIVKEFKKSLKASGMKVPMATTNLFTHPVFKDGAFTSNDPKVRAFAVQKVMRSMDLGAELGAETYVFWGGREGCEVEASKSPLDALKWMREAINFLNAYQMDQGYGFRLALEPKPNEPRGDIYLSTTGNMLAFIETLDHPENVGVNPEFAHETMANLNFAHHVAQAIDAGKLFHIDLNGQKPCRFDQDLRFASEDQKGSFFLVKLLEDSGYDGPRHFDAHAYRSSDLEDVYAFAAGCMRSYLILKEKVRQFNKDKEIQAILKQLKKGGDSPVAGGFSKTAAEQLKTQDFDVEALTNRSLPYEQLDQLVVDLLLGVR